MAFMFPSYNVEPNGSFVCIEQLVLCVEGQAEDWKHAHEDTTVWSLEEPIQNNGLCPFREVFFVVCTQSGF